MDKEEIKKELNRVRTNIIDIQDGRFDDQTLSDTRESIEKLFALVDSTPQPEHKDSNCVDLLWELARESIRVTGMRKEILPIYNRIVKHACIDVPNNFITLEHKSIEEIRKEIKEILEFHPQAIPMQSWQKTEMDYRINSLLAIILPHLNSCNLLTREKLMQFSKELIAISSTPNPAWLLKQVEKAVDEFMRSLNE